MVHFSIFYQSLSSIIAENMEIFIAYNFIFKFQEKSNPNEKALIAFEASTCLTRLRCIYN